MTQDTDLRDLLSAKGFPAIAEIRRLLDDLSDLIQQIALLHARKPSVHLRSLIEAHEAKTRGVMDALGTAINDFVAAKPPANTLEKVRTETAARLRAWSNTSPVFYHVSHTSRNAFDGFEIADLLLDNHPGGADVASQVLDHYYLNMTAVHAYRQRVAQLIEKLASLTAHQAQTAQNVRILNLHTGAARELVALAKERTFARVAELTCVDADAVALRRANQRLNELMTRRMTTFRADPRTFIASPSLTGSLYDIIYATTLFDQLRDSDAAKLISDCLQRLKPGGALLFGNFAPSMPAGERLIIEWAMGWTIRCRSEEHLRRIFAALPNAVQSLQFLNDPFHANSLIVATV